MTTTTELSYTCPHCENGGVWGKGTQEPNCLDCGTTLYEYEAELKALNQDQRKHTYETNRVLFRTRTILNNIIDKTKSIK